MNEFPKLVLVVTIFFATAHAVPPYIFLAGNNVASSVSEAPTERPKCTYIEMMVGSHGIQEAMSFSGTFHNMTVLSHHDLAPLKKRCEVVEYYEQRPNPCSSSYPKYYYYVPFKRICSTVNFLISDFATCQKKLDEGESECYQDWMRNTFSYEGLMSTFLGQEPAIFGENVCMAKTVTDNCGFDSWKEFKKRMIKARNIEKQSYVEARSVMAAFSARNSSNDIEVEILTEIPEEPPASDELRVVKGNCTFFDQILNMQFSHQFGIFVYNLQNVATLNKEDVDALNRQCKPLPRLLDAADHCVERVVRVEGESMIPKTKPFSELEKLCSFVDFFATQFSYCHENLRRIDSNCYSDWANSKQNKETANLCNNVFGEDNCLQGEIKSNCGAEAWVQFRDKVLKIHRALNKRWKGCDGLESL